ncbi:MAG: hypothetical protein Q9223_000782 [Gallowayella weberi]
MAYSRNEIVTALKELYTLFMTLPYVSPDALVFPPPEGWSGVDIEELRARGKTDEVIELLRHLPYLRHPVEVGKRWMIGPDTVEIAYCDGQLYWAPMDTIQPVPGHCIWLTDNESLYGSALLLDTHTGSITEWSPIGHKIMVDCREYEEIPLPDRWMAYATMDATVFFKLCKRRFERLLWMPIYNPRGQAGTVKWYIAAKTREDEEDILDSDDDFEPDSDQDDESGDESSSSGDKNDFAEDSGHISDAEVCRLVEDATGVEKVRAQMDQLQPYDGNTDDDSINIPRLEVANLPRVNLGNLDRKTKVGHFWARSDSKLQGLRNLQLIYVSVPRKFTRSTSAKVGHQTSTKRAAEQSSLNF